MDRCARRHAAALAAAGAKLIALVAPDGAALHQAADVAITVGRPGVDHDAALFSADLGTLAAIRATRARRQRCRRWPPCSAGSRQARAMLTLLSGGRVIDPAQRPRRARRRVVRGRAHRGATRTGRAPDARHDVTGAIVLAGGIDIHSHIAGSNVNTARLLLPELRTAGGSHAAPVSFDIGRLYAAMGFTLVVEPAISPHVALPAQLELAAIPFIDRAILAVLGNEDFLLRPAA